MDMPDVHSRTIRFPNVSAPMALLCADVCAACLHKLGLCERLDAPDDPGNVLKTRQEFVAVPPAKGSAFVQQRQ